MSDPDTSKPVVVGGRESYILEMNIALRRPFRVEEYLAWANGQTELSPARL